MKSNQDIYFPYSNFWKCILLTLIDFARFWLVRRSMFSNFRIIHFIQSRTRAGQLLYTYAPIYCPCSVPIWNEKERKLKQCVFSFQLKIDGNSKNAEDGKNGNQELRGLFKWKHWSSHVVFPLIKCSFWNQGAFNSIGSNRGL